MATNSFIKPEVYSSTALGLLERELLAPSLVWNWNSAEFTGALDDTVNVKVPGRLTARDRSMRATGEDRKIHLDTLTETKISVKMTEFPYSAVPVTDEEMTLDITDFGTQILAPQVRAMAEKLESMVVNEITGATYADGIDADGTNSAKIKGTIKVEDFYGAGGNGLYGALVRARKTLNMRNVDVNNRILLLGADLEEELLNSPNLVKANEAGSDSALRDASIGRIAGFDAIVSNSIPANEAYVFHKTAFVLATAAPVVPDGASFGSSQSANGISLRWLKDYDANYAIDRSILDCFAGADVVLDGGKFLRAVKLTADMDAIATAKAGTASASAGA